MTTAPKINLLALSGSLRRHSANTAVLEALRQRFVHNPSATITLFPLNEVPLFNADIEGEHQPAAIGVFQRAVRACDGLIICCPEYNHGPSGVLKNALDWLSRPTNDMPVKNKPVMLMTAASAATGGVRAIHQLREALSSCYARVLSAPDVVVPRVHEKIVDGKFVDEAVLAFATQVVGDLIREIVVARRAAEMRTL